MERRRPSFLKTISYKPLVQTDSPFSIVSDNTIHETISFLDGSDQIVLMVVLTCNSEKQLSESTPALTSLLSSFRVLADAVKSL